MNGPTILPQNNPHDLRPAAQAIWERIKQVRENLANGGPVVVIMGEAHTSPAHKLLHQAVMALAKENDLSVAYHFEHEHNILGRLLRSREGMKLSPTQEEKLLRADQYGKLTLQASVVFEPIRYAPNSYSNIFGFCVDQKIKTAFVDTSKSVMASQPQQRTLNLREPQTAAMATKILGDSFQAADEIDVESPKGIAIRNRFMAEKSWDITQRQKPDVVIVHCGYHHILGDARFDYSYEESLSKHFQDKTDAVINVFPQHGGCFENIPVSAQKALDKTIVIDGLSTAQFHKDDIDELKEIEQIISESEGLVSRHEPSSKIPQWRKGLGAEAQQLLKRDLG